jgi:DNA-binding NtrC family response regulator
VIALIAPESADRAEIAEYLQSRGFRVFLSDTANVSIAALVAAAPEAVVFDLVASDAVKFLRRNASVWRTMRVICLADRRRSSVSSDALRLGAADIVARPLKFEELQAAIENAAELGAAPSDEAPEPHAQAADTADALFGISPAMQSVMTLVRKVAPSNCTVMIVGERGTGREMVARAIHARGPRRDGAFVKIACAAAEIPDFGPLLGANTGGKSTTVYLDEVGDLRHELQVILDGWLRPQGNQSTVDEIDRPRVIAGAQPRLYDWVDRRIVSRGLVEALSVVRIDLAPLRQRPQDILFMAMHFLKEACRESNVPPKTFSRGALQLLRALPWRGNASELKALCERLTVLVPRGVVQLEDVIQNVRFDAAEAIGRTEETLREARARFERDYVAAVVQHHKGRIGAAAHQLGIERTNLYRKMKQLSIIALLD